jgi:hypothetical protein
MKHFFGELSSLLFIEKNEPCMEYFFSPFSPKYVWCVRKGVWCWCLSNYYRRYFELDKGCSGPSLSLPCLIVSLLPPELIPKAKYQHLDPWSSIRLNDVACAAVLVCFCEWHRIRVNGWWNHCFVHQWFSCSCSYLKCIWIMWSTPRKKGVLWIIATRIGAI